MKVETIIGAVIAAVIAFITGFLALLQQDGVASVSDIAETAWWILLGGAAISFLKDFQALSARRGLSKMTGTGNVHSPVLVGVLALILVSFSLQGCATQRPEIDSINDGIAVSAADIETAAQTIKELCGNVEPGGPCRSDAPISTRTKERLKERLQGALTVLISADRMLAANDAAGADDRVSRTQALLGIIRAELARLQN